MHYTQWALTVAALCTAGATSTALSGLDIHHGVARSTDEQKLLEHIFVINDYDSNSRPVYNSTQNVEVTFGFTLIQILDMVSMRKTPIKTLCESVTVKTLYDINRRSSVSQIPYVSIGIYANLQKA